MSNGDIVRSGNENGSVQREGFGSRELERRGETQSSAMQAQARAEIEARYVMAIQRPRSWENVRIRVLEECKRLGFAQRAFYSIQRGNKPGRITGTPNRIEGLSIRFAEAAIRLSGNVYQQTSTVYDDDFKRVIRVSCVDLETNAAYSKDVVIEKTVERKEAKDRLVLGKRKNSFGDDVYIVQSTDEELLQKEASFCSRALRTEALRLLPADIQEECERLIEITVKAGDAKDPAAARKQIADAFAKLAVMPTDLELYLGCPLAGATAAQVTSLRGLYAAIADNETTFADALREVVQKRDVPQAEETKDAPKGEAKATERLRERATRRKKDDAAKTDPPPQQDPPATTPATANANAAEPNGSQSPEAKLPSDGERDRGERPASSPTPTTKPVPSGTVCMICSNPVGRNAVDTEDEFGTIGLRHPECVWPNR